MSELLALIGTGCCPVIGMIQLGALPGSSRYRGGGIGKLLADALAEAAILKTNGIDALMVQNLGDIPTASCATGAQVAWMTRVASEVQSASKLPVGLNLLENDAEAMFAVASAAELDFVRIKVFIGAMMTPFGPEEAQAHHAIRARTSLGLDHVAIFADVHDRTGTPVGSGGFEEDVEFAVRLGGADGLVLTGKTYEATLDLARRGRRLYPQVPILIGGGATADNFSEIVTVADGAIVSSSMKIGGSAVGAFDPEKVNRFMAAARQVRSSGPSAQADRR